jgi:putative ABC transport system substrate-binding protein
VIALLVNPDNGGEQYIRFMQEAALAKGVKLLSLKAGTEQEIDTAFASLGQLQAGGLVVGADAFFISRREQLVALASRHTVPAIYEGRGFAAAGGLMSYGIDDAAIARQADDPDRLYRHRKPSREGPGCQSDETWGRYHRLQQLQRGADAQAA